MKSARELNHSAARVSEFLRQKYDSTFTISGRINAVGTAVRAW